MCFEFAVPEFYVFLRCFRKLEWKSVQKPRENRQNTIKNTTCITVSRYWGDAWKAECMHFLRSNRVRVAQRPELGKQNVCIFYG